MRNAWFDCFVEWLTVLWTLQEIISEPAIPTVRCTSTIHEATAIQSKYVTEQMSPERLWTNQMQSARTCIQQLRTCMQEATKHECGKRRVHEYTLQPVQILPERTHTHIRCATVRYLRGAPVTTYRKHARVCHRQAPPRTGRRNSDQSNGWISILFLRFTAPNSFGEFLRFLRRIVSRRIERGLVECAFCIHSIHFGICCCDTANDCVKNVEFVRTADCSVKWSCSAE